MQTGFPKISQYQEDTFIEGSGAVGETAHLAFNDSPDGAHADFQTRLMNENGAGRRSGDPTVRLARPETPRFTAFVAALAPANSGRLQRRLGNQCVVLEEPGHDLDNPPAN